MTLARLWSPFVRKELHELGLLWAVGLGLLLILAAVPGSGPDPFSLAVYSLVAVGLGAISFGHDYRHRTLGVALAQPVSRRRLLLVKVAVLISLMAALSALLLIDAERREGWIGLAVLWIAVPASCGLFLAPWFTMLTGKELAGAVFAAAVPAVLLLAAQLIPVVAYGAVAERRPEMSALTWKLFLTGWTLTSAIGAVGSVYSFLRLQAAEPGSPRGRSRTQRPVSAQFEPAVVEPSRRAGPYWTLLVKELRLQSTAFGLAGVFVAGWLAFFWARISLGPQVDLDDIRVVVSVFYSGTIFLVTASVASAEERQYGTLPSQLLLPMAVWKQWTVKVLVVFCVTGLLAIAVPEALLRLMHGLTGLPRPQFAHFWPGIFSLSVAASALCLYASSLSASGLRAALTSIGVLACGGICVAFASGVGDDLSRGLRQVLLTAPWFGGLNWDLPFSWRVFRSWVEMFLFLALVGALLRVAMVNHRALDREPRVVARQVLRMIAITVGAIWLDLLAAGAVDAALLKRLADERAWRTRPPVAVPMDTR